jgi:hypothetical protein
MDIGIRACMYVHTQVHRSACACTHPYFSMHTGPCLPGSAAHATLTSPLLHHRALRCLPHPPGPQESPKRWSKIFFLNKDVPKVIRTL